MLESVILELLKEVDIIVPNSLFSLMKEYSPLLAESGKMFLVLGNMNNGFLHNCTAYVSNCFHNI